MTSGRTRIENAFSTAKADGRIALAPFITGGYPSIEATVPLLSAISEAGADVIELGVPFSDPLAEGPTIQKSSHQALLAGATPRTCMEAVADARRAGMETPVILMGYYNPVLAMGLDRYCSEAAQAGADGLIVPDLPTPEAGPLLDACAAHGLALIPLLALTSTEESIALACESGSGFVYCISVLGVTGARTTMDRRVRDLVATVRGQTSLPVAVGFGVSGADHVREIAEYADGAIVGSALINAIADANPDEAPGLAAQFIRALAPGTTLPEVAK